MSGGYTIVLAYSKYIENIPTHFKLPEKLVEKFQCGNVECLSSLKILCKSYCSTFNMALKFVYLSTLYANTYTIYSVG